MSISFDEIKNIAIDTFETSGKELFDEIVGSYKDVAESKAHLGEKYAKLLMQNGKDLIQDNITQEQHDANVEALWNAEKSDTFATGYEEKATAVKALTDGLKILAHMARSVVGKLTP